MWSDDEKRAYNRGYAAGSRRYWPAHRPPVPPHPVVASLMEALQKLRDATDQACATLDGEDDFVKQLAPWIGKADEAMTRVTQWLKEETK